MDLIIAVDDATTTDRSSQIRLIGRSPGVMTSRCITRRSPTSPCSRPWLSPPAGGSDDSPATSPSTGGESTTVEPTAATPTDAVGANGSTTSDDASGNDIRYSLDDAMAVQGIDLEGLMPTVSAETRYPYEDARAGVEALIEGIVNA